MLQSPLNVGWIVPSPSHPFFVLDCCPYYPLPQGKDERDKEQNNNQEKKKNKETNNNKEKDNKENNNQEKRRSDKEESKP